MLLELSCKYKPYKYTNDTFAEFYRNEDLSHITKWLDCIQAENQRYCKDDNRAKQLREEGNKLFVKKRYAECLNKYTSSLKYATCDSSNYAFALGNRSAVAFDLKQYQHCLDEIDVCLAAEYPTEKREKLLKRRAECINQLATCKYGGISYILPVSNSETFQNATNNVKLISSNEKGRHVVASKDLQPGDILFVERARNIAPIFTSENNCLPNKCYHCLTDSEYLIPCRRCTVAMYCSMDCRDASWLCSHQFECGCMLLWFHLGIGLLAFKCAMSKMNCTGCMGEQADDASTTCANCQPFDELIDNLELMENVTPLIVVAGAIVLYLKQHTTFFNRFSIAEHKFGDLMLKNSAKLLNNASVIEHWRSHITLNDRTLLHDAKFAATHDLFDMDESEAVACGIFPSISMMNHSCKTNISIYAFRDVMIARAITPIRCNEEIFNSYGVNYMWHERDERQATLQGRYHFTCRCEICTNDEEEFVNKYNSPLCANCSNAMWRKNNTGKDWHCKFCNSLRDEREYNIINDRIMVKLDNANDIHEVENLLKKMNKLYSKRHNYFVEAYHKLSLLYERKGDDKKSMACKVKLCDLFRTIYGARSRKYLLYKIDNFEDSQEELNLLKLYYPLEEININ